jgi:hypothetical protein
MTKNRRDKLQFSPRKLRNIVSMESREPRWRRREGRKRPTLHGIGTTIHRHIYRAVEKTFSGWSETAVTKMRGELLPV